MIRKTLLPLENRLHEERLDLPHAARRHAFLKDLGRHMPPEHAVGEGARGVVGVEDKGVQRIMAGPGVRCQGVLDAGPKDARHVRRLVDVAVQAQMRAGLLDESPDGLRPDGFAAVQRVQPGVKGRAVEHADGAARVFQGDSCKLLLDAVLPQRILAVRAWAEPTRIAHDGELARHVGIVSQVSAGKVLDPEGRVRHARIAHQHHAVQGEGLSVDVRGLGQQRAETFHRGDPVVVARHVRDPGAGVGGEEGAKGRGEIVLHEADLRREVVLEVGAAAYERQGARDDRREEVAAQEDDPCAAACGQLRHLFVQVDPSVQVTGIERFHG